MGGGLDAFGIAFSRDSQGRAIQKACSGRGTNTCTIGTYLEAQASLRLGMLDVAQRDPAPTTQQGDQSWGHASHGAARRNEHLPPVQASSKPPFFSPAPPEAIKSRKPFRLMSVTFSSLLPMPTIPSFLVALSASAALTCAARTALNSLTTPLCATFRRSRSASSSSQ